MITGTDRVDPMSRRPEFAANRVPCLSCDTPDAYAPGTCPATGGFHVSQFDAAAGGR